MRGNEAGWVAFPEKRQKGGKSSCVAEISNKDTAKNPWFIFTLSASPVRLTACRDPIEGNSSTVHLLVHL